MNILMWFIGLTLSAIACSNPSTNPASTIDGPHGVTALLNDSTWYGSANASKTVAISGSSDCIANRFDILFSTDLPYDANAPKHPVTGCSGDCTPTQSLSFHNVPLAVGTYEIAALNTCAGPGGAVTYYWILGGDAIVNTYNSGNKPVGWIQVTGYNASQNAVEGAFEIDLVNQTTQAARFRKGAFNALVK